jgi:hypothetical protein
MKGPLILTIAGALFGLASFALFVGSLLMPALTNGRASVEEATAGVVVGLLCGGVSGLIFFGGVVWLIVAAASGSKRPRAAMPTHIGYQGAPGSGGPFPTGAGAAGTQAWQQPSSYAKPPLAPSFPNRPVATATPGEGRLFLLLGGLAVCVVLLGGAVAAGAYILMNLNFGRDQSRPAQADGGFPADRLGGGANDNFVSPWHEDGFGGADAGTWPEPAASGSPFETRPFPEPGFGGPDLTFGQQEHERLLRDMEARHEQQMEEFRRQQEEIRRQNEELIRRPLPPTSQPPGFRPPF